MYGRSLCFPKYADRRKMHIVYGVLLYMTYLKATIPLIIISLCLYPFVTPTDSQDHSDITVLSHVDAVVEKDSARLYDKTLEGNDQILQNKTFEESNIISEVDAHGPLQGGSSVESADFTSESSGRLLRSADADSSKDVYSSAFSGVRHQVSGLLMGFNLVYPHESDAIWDDGKIEGYMRDLDTRLLRWPGGTVSSYYHWNELTGEGWRDSWDPENPVTPKPGSEYMDVTEYMDVVRRTGATPLVGINMSSGWRWDRLEDGIEEALELMRFLRDQNFEVTYWYLDNEPYQHDSNGGEKTVEEYAELINHFVPRMKEINPDIKTVANWLPAFELRRSDYQTLMELAGENIDVIDVHNYWSWNYPSMEKWLEHTPNQLWIGSSYINEIHLFREMVRDFGYPEMKLASLEWNVGPLRENQLTAHQVALIQTEMLMQFIIGGLDMATFWPLQWPGNYITARPLVSSENNEKQPNYPLFKFLGEMQGGKVLQEDVIGTLPHILSLAVEDDEYLRIALLNKNDSDVEIQLRSDHFENLNLERAEVYTLLDEVTNSELKTLNGVDYTGGEITFTAEEISITLATFKKN